MPAWQRPLALFFALLALLLFADAAMAGVRAPGATVHAASAHASRTGTLAHHHHRHRFHHHRHRRHGHRRSGRAWHRPVPVADGAPDARVAQTAYAADTIVPLTGADHAITMIVLAPDERIETVAVGDSSGWQVTPSARRNILFVMPMRAGAASNMAVVTDRRTYLFDLATAARGQPPLYALRFAYEPAGTDPPIAVARADGPPMDTVPAG